MSGQTDIVSSYKVNNLTLFRIRDHKCQNAQSPPKALWCSASNHITVLNASLSGVHKPLDRLIATSWLTAKEMSPYKFEHINIAFACMVPAAENDRK